MGSFNTKTTADLTGTGQNAGVDVSDLETASYWVFGTFVGTVQMQVSPDGTNWVDEGSPVSAAARISIPQEAKQARLDCTAYTSGTIESAITGIDDDRLG